MSMRTSLVLTGDASGAEAALKTVDRALDAGEKGVADYAAAYAKADRAIGDLARAQALAAGETKAAKAAYDAGETSLAAYKRSLLETKSALSLVETQHRQAMTELKRTGASIGPSLAQATAGYVNLGRQVQDVAVQLQSGTNIGTIIAQQGGQVADAVAMMGGRFSGLAGFLAGPWGAAITVGAGVLLNSLIPALFGAGDEAEKTRKKHQTLTDVLNDSKSSWEEVAAAAEDYAARQAKANETTLQTVKAEAAAIDARLRSAMATREKLKAELELREFNLRVQAENASSGDPGAKALIAAAAVSRDSVKSNIAAQEAEIASLGKAAQASVGRVATELAKLNSDPAARIKAGFTELRSEAHRTIRDVDTLTARLTELDIREKARLDVLQASSRASRSRAPRVESLTDTVGNQLLASAQRYSGASERSAGGRSTLQDLFRQANLNVDPKITAWCAAFVNSVLATNGLQGNGALNARSFLTYGKGVDRPEKGDIVVLKRGNNAAQGHVGFYAGEGRNGQILVTGGNQGNKVSTAGFSRADVLAYRRPLTAGEQETASARELEQIDQLAQKAAASIGQITAQWDQQPKLIDQIDAAVGSLDATIAELAARKPAGYEALIAQAEAAKKLAQGAPGRMIADWVQESERGAQLAQLTAAGMGEQAHVLETVWGWQKRLVDVSAEQLATIEAQARAEYQVNQAMQRRQEMASAYLDATRSVASTLEQILAGQGKLSDFKSIFRQLNARVLTDKLFGDAMRGLDDFVKRDVFAPAVDGLVQDTNRASSAIAMLADAATGASGHIATGHGGALAGQFGGLYGTDIGASLQATDRLTSIAIMQALDNASGSGVGARFGPMHDTMGGPWAKSASGEIAQAVRAANRETLSGLTPATYFAQMTRSITDPLAAQLDTTFGTTFFSRMSGVFAGALQGYATAGKVGLALGGAKGLVDTFGEKILGRDFATTLSSHLGGALAGAQKGTQTAGFMKMLGIKTSTTGSQIGGAVGALLKKLPGGALIGSIAGGLLGGLFKKKPKGTVTITEAGSTYSGSGKLRDALGGAGDSVSGALASIAERLNAEVGSFSASIRQKGKKIYVNGARVADMEAAQQKALQDAIAGGAVKGISAAVQKALGSSSDVDKALAEALKVQDVEILVGGIGAELRKAFGDFEKQAAERLRIARQYGFDVVSLEARNAEDRKKLTEKLLADQVGGLQKLIDDMTSGSLFEGSAVAKRTALLGEIDKVRADAAAGKDGAADKLSGLLEQLNAVSKDVYGTTGGFAADRSAILDTARQTIAAANQRIADAQRASDPALATTNAALDENNDQNARIIAELAQMNAALAQWGGAALVAPASGLARLASTAVM